MAQVFLVMDGTERQGGTVAPGLLNIDAILHSLVRERNSTLDRAQALQEL